MNSLRTSQFVVIATVALLPAACGSAGQQPASTTSTGGTPWTPTGVSSSSPACDHPSATLPATDWLQVTVNGLVRYAVVRVPADARPAQPLPVLLSFHGAGSDVATQESIDEFSSHPSFVVVYPEGSLVDANSVVTNVNGWDSAGKKVDEPAFVAALLDTLGNAVCIDPSRVFAAGHSNGGMLVTTLPCAFPGRIAGIAAVEGGYDFVACPQGPPTPTLVFHGLNDKVAPIAGNSVFVPVADLMAAAAKRNGCTAGPQTAAHGSAAITLSWTGCAAPTVLYELKSHGHAWPGHVLPISEFTLESAIASGSGTVGSGLTPKQMAENMLLTNTQVDASQVIRDFFTAGAS